MKTLALAVALAACLAGAAVAQTPQSDFAVLEADARIQSSRSITDIRRIDPDTYLIKAGVNRWYKAEVTANCGAGVSPVAPIVLDSGPMGQIDVHSRVVLETGRVCEINQLDRIAAPARS